MDSFVQWRHFLEGSPYQVIIFNDHKNLSYFQNARVLNRRQARWAQFLTRLDFKIAYRPGKQQGKADALSRRSYLAPRPGDPAFDCYSCYSSKSLYMSPIAPVVFKSSKVVTTTIWRDISVALRRWISFNDPSGGLICAVLSMTTFGPVMLAAAQRCHDIIPMVCWNPYRFQVSRGNLFVLILSQICRSRRGSMLS